jgi:tetratricopeptide (TPR) repeat protein
MNRQLIVKLHQHIKADDWAWVLVALRQDRLIWQSLESSDLGEKALSAIPSNGEKWTPAALALLALGNQYSPESLIASPVDPIGEDVKHMADSVYETWVKMPASDDLSLVQIGWIALALRERRLLRTSWNFLSAEINNLREASKTSLACLYGIVPDPFDLIMALFKLKDNKATNLALHTLLSNPLPTANQAVILKALSSHLSESQFQELLSKLHTLRPDLAACLANHRLGDHLDITILDQALNQIGFDQPPVDKLRKLTFHYAQSFYREIASQPEGEIFELDHALDATQKLQAYLIASKGTAYRRAILKGSYLAPDAEINNQEAIIAWRQAAEMVPQDAFLSAGLARALLDYGDIDGAQSVLYLNEVVDSINKGEEEKSPEEKNHQWADHIEKWKIDPAWLATSALVTARAGQNELARHYLQDTLLHLEDAYTLRDFLPDLAKTSLYLDLYKEAEKYCHLGLSNGCPSADILPILSQVQLVLGLSSEALNNAYLACTLQPGDIELDRVLIHCLASNEEWQAAWIQQKQLMQQNKSVTVEEYLELAEYASNSGHQPDAIQACQQALKLDANNGSVYQLLGQVALVLGDQQAALENYHLATQLSPHLSSAWVILAKLYADHSENTKALEILQTGNRAAPDSPEINLMIGTLLLEDQYTTQSLPYLRRAAFLAYLDGSTTLPPYRAIGKAVDILRDNIGYTLCKALRQLGYLDEARHILEIIYSSDQRSIQPSTEISYAYANILLALKEADRALPILENILQDQPDHSEAVMDYMRALIASTDQPNMSKSALPILYELTGKECEQTDTIREISSVTLSPTEQAESYALLAEALNINGNAIGAIEAYREALGKTINHDPVWRQRLTLGLAQVAMSAGWYEVAITAYLEALQIEPQSSQFQSLSEAYEALNLIEEAYQAASEAIRLCENAPEVLVWFAEQSLALSYTNTIDPIDQELAIQSLKSAIDRLPPRANLVVLLGRLYARNNDRETAIHVFNSLVKDSNDELRLNIDDLYQASIYMRELGEYAHASNLINKAILLYQSESSKDYGIESNTYKRLLVELSNIYQLSGDPENALHAIDMVIDLAPTELSNYLSKSKLHLELNQVREAITCHEKALKLDSSNTNLHVQVALLKWLNGNLPGAFANIQRAIQLSAEHEDFDSQYTAQYLAVELSGGMLLAEQAVAFVEVQPIDNRSVEANCLLSEYYLENNDVDRANQALLKAAEILPQATHTLALQARLTMRKSGLFEIGTQLLKSAIENLPTPADFNITENLASLTIQECFANLINRIRFSSMLRHLSRATLEFENWEVAIPLLEQTTKHALPEARIHFEKARALVLCAEAQRLCQALSIIRHAPGEDAISEAANQSFLLSINTTQNLIREFLSSVDTHIIQDQVSTNPCPDAVSDTLIQGLKKGLQLAEYWYVRGQYAFSPSSGNADRFLLIQESHLDQVQNSAVLVDALSQTGRVSDAQVIIRPVMDHPYTRIHLSLALAGSDGPQAIEVARQTLENLGHMSIHTPGAEPSLYALLAIIGADGGTESYDPNANLQSLLPALSIWPDEPRWHSLAAKQYLELKDSLDGTNLSSALFHFQQASQLEPDNGIHYLNLGLFYLERGDAQQAIQPLEKATEICHQLPQAWLALASAQKATGFLNKALINAERAVENNPSPLAAILMKGEIALLAGDPTIALSCSTSALNLQPDHQQALYLHARALEIQDKPVEALSALDRAIFLNNNDIETQVARARLVIKIRNPEASLPALQDLANNYPNEPRILAMLSKCLVEVGQTDQAARTAQFALQSGHNILDDQEDCQLHYLIGVQSRRSGQLDQAIHHLSEAIRKAPEFVDSYLELGSVYQDRRQNTQAVEVFMAAAKIAPQDFRPYYHSGLALKESRDYIEAENMLRHAAHLAPQEVSVHRQLGAVVALNLVHNRRLAPTDKVTL